MTDEQIEAEARTGAVEFLTHQTQDMARARAAVERALAWQEHLFQADRFDAAGEIVTAVYDVLARWGQRDLAKGLLRRSIETRKDDLARAAAQGNLATLLQQEGRLAEALATYEQVYQTFVALDAKYPMSSALNQMGAVLMAMGEHDQAIKRYESALQLKRETGDEEGQAISLHQLSMLYRRKKDHETALARSQESEKLNRKLDRQVGIASNLHEQGVIFNRMDRPDEAFERFRESMEINRRIGDESGSADSLGELGKLLMTAGRMREAIAAFNECLDIHQRRGDPKMGIDLSMLGEIHERQGEYAAALEKYQQARHIYQQAMPTNLPIIERKIARVRQKLGG
jgi:tetratricopeptide (TPR) repeat protein